MGSIRFNLLLPIFFIITVHAYSQELTFGDASVVKGIKKKTSDIYANSDQTTFFLTKKAILPSSVNGVSIVAHQANGQINRIITVAMNADGQSSIEWYFDLGKLIFVYEVFEFFNESPNKGTWKNFKGLYGSESRYYFSQGKLTYHKHVGRTDITADFKGDSLLEIAKNITDYLNQK